LLLKTKRLLKDKDETFHREDGMLVTVTEYQLKVTGRKQAKVDFLR
jgi:hypothetical protein